MESKTKMYGKLIIEKGKVAFPDGGEQIHWQTEKSSIEIEIVVYISI